MWFLSSVCLVSHQPQETGYGMKLVWGESTYALEGFGFHAAGFVSAQEQSAVGQREVSGRELQNRSLKSLLTELLWLGAILKLHGKSETRVLNGASFVCLRSVYEWARSLSINFFISVSFSAR